MRRSSQTSVRCSRRSATVARVLTAAAFVPSPPLLVPDLTGAAAQESEPLRRAALEAATQLGRAAAEWVAVGVGAAEATVPAGAVGTFRGFGVDVRVALGPHAGSDPGHGSAADPAMPLAALIAGWLRTRAAPTSRVTTHVLPADIPPADCARLGARLRAEWDRNPEPRGLLVIADGVNTLTPAAPGAFDPRATRAQAELDAALAVGDVTALARLDPVLCRELGIGGRPAWQVLAGVFDTAGGTPSSCTTLYADAPYGVGYSVGV